MNYGFGYHGDMENDFGQTETIFTTSGGQSGSGFTGAAISGGHDYTRLVNQIGAAPGCALGNCCSGFNDRNSNGLNCGGNMFGVIVDIPNDRRAAIVRNTVGGHW